MGTIVHDAVIVTGSDDDTATEQAKEFAYSLGLITTNIVDSFTNGYKSFMIATCGSKNGWNTKETYIDCLSQFLDNVQGVEWVRVKYGECCPEMVSHSQ